jgi:hypothetical protein
MVAMAVGSPTNGRWPMAPTSIGNGSKSMQLGPLGATGPTAGPNAVEGGGVHL